MAEGINRVFLLGNLGADPELRFTQGNQAVLNIRVATAERYQDREGAWQERTEWHAVVVWGKRAEGLAKILVKGSQVCIEGRLRTTSYEAKDGAKRYKTEIQAEGIYLCGSASANAGDGGRRRESTDAGRNEDEY